MKTSLLIKFTLVIIVLSFSRRLDQHAGAANWPQWRGPGGTGVSAEKNLPAEWGPAKNIRWKTPLAGRGHSSPVVWENKIFLTTAIEGDVVPGAKAVVHMDDGNHFCTPTVSARIVSTPSK
jgi:hypothetical protein